MKIRLETASIHGEYADLDDDEAQRYIDAGLASVETAEVDPAPVSGKHKATETAVAPDVETRA